MDYGDYISDVIHLFPFLPKYFSIYLTIIAYLLVISIYIAQWIRLEEWVS